MIIIISFTSLQDLCIYGTDLEDMLEEKIRNLKLEHDVMFLKQTPQRSCDRLRTRNRIYNDIINGLPPENNKLYLKHKPGSLWIKIKSEDEEQSSLFNFMKLTDKALNVEQNEKKIKKLKEM